METLPLDLWKLFRHGVPLLVFVVFLALCMRVRPGDTFLARGSVRVLVYYTVAVSMVAGIAGKDLWPFAAWRYVPYAISDTGHFLRLVVVDENGREHSLDLRVFEPLQGTELLGYLERRPPSQRNEVLRFLLRRAQEGLARAHAGMPLGTYSRILGPAAAPLFHVTETRWDRNYPLPRELMGLRLYKVSWRATGATVHTDQEELLADVWA